MHYDPHAHHRKGRYQERRFADSGGIKNSVNIDCPAGDPHIAPVPQVLVVLISDYGFPGGLLVPRILEPQIILVRDDLLSPGDRTNRERYENSQYASHITWYLEG